MLFIFDCDGVLLDSIGADAEIESSVYHSLGIDISPQEIVWRFSGSSQKDMVQTLEKETGISIPPEAASEISRQKKIVHATGRLATPGIHQVLEDLSWASRCVASGTGMEALVHNLSVVGLYNSFFPSIFSSEQVAKGKPFPDLFLFAANKMGYSAERCFVIEDGISGVQAARAAGMRVVGYTGGSHCMDDHGIALQKAGADILCSDMSALPKLIKDFLPIDDKAMADAS